MTVPPIDPSFATTGADWQMPKSTPDVPATGDAGGFGDMLTKSIGSLANTQNDAATASQAFAAGTSTDPTAVVMAVERAKLAMQLASQIRTKAVDAANDLFHTQI